MSGRSAGHRRRGLGGRLARAAVVAATAGLVLGTVLRLSGWASVPWPGPSLLAFTPYLVPLGAVLLAALAWRRRWREAALAGVAVATLLALVVPRTVARDQPDPGPGARTIRVMSVNLLRDGADPVALAALVRARRPDVLSLQEATPAFVRRLNAAGVGAVLPRSVVLGGARYHDTAVLSRWPIVRTPSTLPSVFLTTLIVMPGGPPVPFLAAHPNPPILPAGQGRWRGWLAAIPEPAGQYAGGLLAGDLNATLDHAELRAVLDRGWRDAAREVGAGLTPTWHGLPGARITIDHVLVPPGAAVRGYAVDDLPGSDHRAITAVVALPRPGSAPAG